MRLNKRKIFDVKNDAAIYYEFFNLIHLSTSTNFKNWKAGD